MRLDDKTFECKEFYEEFIGCDLIFERDFDLVSFFNVEMSSKFFT